MGTQKNYKIDFLEYDSLNDLTKVDQKLLYRAVEAAKDAYAPYSEFQVGSAVRLTNGKVVIGSNQENAAYPSGLCAERVALFAASANYPNEQMQTIAIYANNAEQNGSQISPCGSCRQVMSEYEQKQGTNIRVLLMNADGLVWEFYSSQALLPFAFYLKPFKN